MNIKMTERSRRQNLGIEAAPHLHAKTGTSAIMAITAACLVPAFAVQVYFTGFGIVWQLCITLVTAAVCEVLCALLRHRGIFCFLKDYSFIITSMLLAMTLPPLLPWYLSCAATVFAILLVKEAFGGLGMNIFNPAMAGFIFIFISSSNFMFQSWVTPHENALSVASPKASYEVIFEHADAKILRDEIKAMSVDIPDAFTGATWLESVKTARKAGGMSNTFNADPLSQSFRGYVFLCAALLIGGIVLMVMRIVFIRMVLSYFISLLVFAGFFYCLYPQYFLPPLQELLFGGSVIAGFFIITDPVTNAGTAKGRIIYAVLTAFLIVMIRAFGSYSDAVAFSVMLSNAAAPLIDVLTRRRTFGQRYKKGMLD